jgi:hypothetical protein
LNQRKRFERQYFFSLLLLSSATLTNLG